MGLLDNLQLGHGANFGGGLLDFLRTTQMQQNNYQPGAGFGQPPMEANAQMTQAAPMQIGNYQMPRIGSPEQFTPDPAAIPQNAQPTQGQMPQMPQESPGGFGAGLQGFLRNLHTGPIGAIAGGVGSAMGMQDSARQQQNQTAQFLVSKGMDPAMAKTVVSDPVLLRSVLPQMMGMGGGQTDDIKEYQFAKKEEPGLTFQQYMARKRATSGEFGLTPIWGTGPDGKPAYIQPGKSGEARLAKLPEGFNISRDPVKIEGPTGTTILDPQTRQVVGFIPKDVAGAAREAAKGKGLGDADVDLASIRSKMPGLETVVKKLDDLSGKATYTIAGKVVDYATRQANMEPREAAVARAEYTSMVDNQILPLLRDTFGAAFTQKEGDTLRATLGDPDKSPKEKQAILKSFIEQKRRDIEALETRTGAAPAATTTAPKRIRLNADGTIAQ